MKKSVLALALFFFLVLNLINALGSEKVAVHAARMIDVKLGEVVNDVYVLIEGERIAGMGGREIAQGAKVIDLGDVTLLPGLIDMHTHLTFDLFGDYLVDFLKDTAADTALRAAKNAKATLDAGFTTVRDISAKEFAVLVELGMNPLEAIRAATLHAVDLLGVDDRGVIEKGRLADLITVKRNPLEDIRTLENVFWIMKGGKVYKDSR